MINTIPVFGDSDMATLILSLSVLSLRVEYVSYIFKVYIFFILNFDQTKRKTKSQLPIMSGTTRFGVFLGIYQYVRVKE